MARSRITYALVVLLALLLPVAFLLGRRSSAPAASGESVALTQSASTSVSAKVRTPSGSTNIFAHNLLLRKGPNFRVYVRWLRGQLAPARKNVSPSFDDPESFFLDIKTGVLRVNIGDLTNYFNSSLTDAPLKNISLSGDGDQVKLKGDVHKVFSLPVEITATLSALPDSRIQAHVTKLNVLKIPLKGLLGGFHVKLADLIHPQGVPGIQISGNDIFFDPQTLLPPPHIRGQLKQVHIVNPDLEEIYGDPTTDAARVEQWRNFLHLTDGSLSFGKIIMRPVDIMMIDVSQDLWFNLDLANIQKQLVNGYSRMTPEAGLQIFMPDLRDIPDNKDNQSISIEWFKNRNIPPPADVLPKKPKP